MVNRSPDHFKFRLLCKGCNSYKHTSITLTKPLVPREGAMSGLLLTCSNCDIEATDLDERRQ
jgi:hypothetical protein